MKGNTCDFFFNSPKYIFYRNFLHTTSFMSLHSLTFKLDLSCGFHKCNIQVFFL